MVQDRTNDETVAVNVARQHAKSAAGQPDTRLPAGSSVRTDIKLPETAKSVSLADQQYVMPLVDLVSRFTQATNELQLMGIVKADARKKRGKFAQRLTWATSVSM